MNKKCIICGKDFYVKPSHFKKRKCCSVGCKIEAQVGKKHTEEHKRKIGLAVKNNPNCIKHLTHRFKKGHPYRNTGRTRFKKGQKPWNDGLKGYRAGVPHPWMPKGKDHYNWQNGKSFEPYGLEFNNDLKEVIRNRDRRKCRRCEMTELENGRKLTVHHIDYNKQNNDPKNLISLCDYCHAVTNFNRDYWIKFFEEKNYGR